MTSAPYDRVEDTLLDSEVCDALQVRVEHVLAAADRLCSRR